MFPDIVREEIFRLETRRLWLRWPHLADVVAHADSLPETASGDPYRFSLTAGEVADRLAANEAGRALHLVLNGRGTDRRPFGEIALIPVRDRIENCGLKLTCGLDPSRAGKGLMTEAVQAVVDAAFLLIDTPLVAASARVRDPGFRRVLEKCGFAYCGNGLDSGTDGLVASDRFRLDRKTWESLKSWRIPAVVRARGQAAEACRPGA